jgi:hypothetical protein
VLSIALITLSVTVALGIALSVLHLRGSSTPHWMPRWMISALHGILGAAGLGALILALRGPPRGIQTGVAAFGSVAAVLLASALVVGLGIATLARRSGRGVGLLIAVHGTAAITAYVLLTAYISLG